MHNTKALLFLLRLIQRASHDYCASRGRATDVNLVSRTPLISAQTGDPARYLARVIRAMEIARAAGLHYVGDDNASVEKPITCHACDALLVRGRPACVDADGRQVYR